MDIEQARMPETPREAIEELLFYVAPIYGKSVHLQATDEAYWLGFEKAKGMGLIDEIENSYPYRRTFRLVRKGYDYAVREGLIKKPKSD